MARHLLPLLWLLCAALATVDVSAQEIAPPAVRPGALSSGPAPPDVRRPYRGLFAQNAGDRDRPYLDLRLSLYGAFDNDIYSNEPNASPAVGNTRQRGWFGGTAAALNYMRPGEHIAWGLGAGASLNYYPERRDTTQNYRASGMFSVSLGRRTGLNTSGSIGYAPEFRLGLFVSPGGSQDAFSNVSPDLDIYSMAAYRTSASLNLSHRFTSRSSFELWYSRSDVNYVDEPIDYGSQTTGFQYRHELTRDLALRAGYNYSDASYAAGVGARQKLHNLDVGVDYGRALSISRRTHFSFSTGSSVVVRNEETASAVNNGPSLRFAGSAQLTHEIGRTWTAALAYRRSIDLHEGFTQPFLSDAVNATFGGLMAPRLRFSAVADYAFGTVGVGSDDRFDSLSASAGFEVGISRALAFYARYVYYRYNFDDQVVVDPRMVRALDRQAVRFGLTAFLPLMGHKKDAR